MEGFATNKYSDGFFNVSPTNGFLPISRPLLSLPQEYEQLEYISSNLHRLIKEQLLEEYVVKLPEYNITTCDPQLLQALFRSYTFIVSAYLLEPAYQHYKQHNTYGKARSHVPSNLSIPLFNVASKLDVMPYLDYHYAYCLGNYKVLDESKPLTWDNLEMIVKFDGGLDERGFVMVHVDINTFGKHLLESIDMVYDGFKTNNTNNITNGLKLNYETMIQINKRRKEMWGASDHRNYNDFRVFIMGSLGNDKIFGPDGVIYEGVSESGMKFRGQTGAQDDIIPCEDIFTGVTNYYETNELTKYLLNLREYRPKCVQLFFKDLGEYSDEYNLLNMDTDLHDAYVYYLGIVDEIFNFRNGHWQFVQKYIMKNTTYNVATGGTPITTWIPNQLLATLNCMGDIINKINSFDNINSELFNTISSNYVQKRHILEEQIKELHNKIYNVDVVIGLNKNFSESK